MDRRAGIGYLQAPGAAYGPESSSSARAGSDPRFSLVELARVKERVNAILGGRADVMTRDSLHPLLRERIEASAIRVF
jgi:hypothetical protein